MDKQQVYEALCAKCQELTYTTVKPIDNDWCVVTYNCFGQISFCVYLLADGEEMPERNIGGCQLVPVVIFDGTNACVYALPYANKMWYCNQPLTRQFDKLFITKIYSLLDNIHQDNRYLQTIELAKADMPHIIIAYVRNYELAKSITNGLPNDVLDNVILSALQKQNFQIVQHNVIPLHVPIVKKDFIINHLFGIYKRGWYNIVVLPEEQMQQQNKDIAIINHLLTNIPLEIYYVPKYEFGVEILPYPMTWSMEWTNKDIPNIKDLYCSTFQHLSEQI